MAYESTADLESAGFTLERSVVPAYQTDSGYEIPAKHVLTVSKDGEVVYEAVAYTEALADTEAVLALS